MRVSAFFLYSYLFLLLTALHLEFLFLEKLHLEFLFLCLFFLSLLVEGVRNWPRMGQGSGEGLLTFLPWSLLCAGLALSPAFNSLFTEDYLQILGSPEYKSFVKILLVAPFLPLYCQKEEEKRKLIHFVLFCFFILGLNFLYHYLWLGERREFDLRPLISTRHGDPNFLCTFFGGMVPLLLWYLGQKAHSWTGFGWKLLLLVFFMFCCLLTQSRMGLISLVLVMSLHLLHSRRLQLLCVGILLATGGALWGMLETQSLFWPLDQFIERFQNMEDASNQKRWASWMTGIQLFMDHPFWGVGFKKSSQWFFKISGYPQFQSEGPLLEVHNTPLALLAEMGVGGSAFFFLFFGFCIVRTWRAWKGGIDHSSRMLARSCLLMLLYVGLNGLTLHAAYKDVYLFFFIFSLTLSGLGTTKRPKFVCTFWSPLFPSP